MKKEETVTPNMLMGRARKLMNEIHLPAEDWDKYEDARNAYAGCLPRHGSRER